VRKTLFLIVNLLLAIAVFGQDETLRGNHYNIDKFDGGMVTDYDIADTDPNFADYITNLMIDKGKLYPRKGYDVKFDFEFDHSDSSSGLSCPMMWDSTGSPFLKPLDIFTYSVQRPMYDSLRTLAGNVGEVTICTFFDTVETSGALLWCMYPSYSGDTTNPEDGDWSAAWSKDYNMPNGQDVSLMNYMVAPGRTIRNHWYDPLDFVTYNGIVRAAAGDKKGELDGTTIWTDVLWFGPIQRYRWGSGSVLNDFYLYPAYCFRPAKSVVVEDSVGAVPISKPSGWDLTDGEALEGGRYFFKIAYEFDGYQYSQAVGDSDWYVDVVSDSIIQINFIKDSLETSARLTAIIIFTTDVVGSTDSYYDYPGADPVPGFGATAQDWYIWNTNIPQVTEITGLDGIDFNSLIYYYRKRVVIADIDTTELGFKWKANNISNEGGQVEWYATNDDMEIPVWIDKDDIDAAQPDMWSFLGHNSTEQRVQASRMELKDGIAYYGDVRIDGDSSKVKDHYGNMVIVSPPGKPDVMAINNFITVGSGAGDRVTGIKSINDNLAIFTQRSLEIWSEGYPPQRLAQYPGMGCEAPLSIQVTPYGIFYVNSRGVILYEPGEYPKLISKLIETSFDSCNVVNSTSSLPTLPYGVGCYFPDENLYTFWCNTVGTSEVDTTAISSYLDNNPADGGSETCGNGLWGYLGAAGHGGGPGGGGTGPSASSDYGGNGGVYVYNIDLNAWTRWGTYDGFSRFTHGVDGEVYGIVGMDTSRQYVMQMFHNPVEGGDPPNGTYFDYNKPFNTVWDSGWTDFGYPGIEKSNIEAVLVDYYSEAPITRADPVTIYLYNEGYSTPFDTLLFDYTDSLRYIEYQRPTRQPGKTNINGQWPVYLKLKAFLADSSYDEVNSIKVIFKPEKLREH